ncbi:hypothetical protein [Actinoplanes sp. NPDC051851]|uniref:hypothetical protein n=1 Tax=Actinoplanes sp. NPDC051851 TaxID=3154753 RepID=UPI003435D782
MIDAAQDRFPSGHPWLGMRGERVRAHGGSVLRVHETFYRYGESEQLSTTGTGIRRWGTRFYPSHDLYDSLPPAQKVDQPDIVFNERTGRYICWIKVMGSEFQESTVLVVDPIDRKAYHYFERMHSELICAGLNADYTGRYSTHFPHPHPLCVRAMAHPAPHTVPHSGANAALADPDTSIAGYVWLPVRFGGERPFLD